MYVISSRIICSALFTLLVALSADIVSAAGSAPAPAPATDCVQTLINVSNCLAYVMAGSNATDPDMSCCIALQGVVADDEQMGTADGAACLCGAMNNRPGLGVQLNLSKVYSLTDACVQSIPSVTNCSSRFPSNVPRPASPPETVHVSAGIRAFGGTDSSSLLALTAVAVALFYSILI